MPAMFEGGGISRPSGGVGPRGAPGAVQAQRKKKKAASIKSERRRDANYAKRAPSSSRSRGSSGGGSSSRNRSSGGGGSGSNSSGRIAALAAPEVPVSPPPPSINAFLAEDDTYQAQMAALAKALTNYKTQMGQRQGEYNTDFANRLSELNTQEDRSTIDQADDYAGRGMYISGLYGKARGDLEQDFNRRETDMNTAKTSFMNALSRDFTNFNEENSLSNAKARQEALDRRAAKYLL